MDFAAFSLLSLFTQEGSHSSACSYTSHLSPNTSVLSLKGSNIREPLVFPQCIGDAVSPVLGADSSEDGVLPTLSEEPQPAAGPFACPP